MSTLWDESYKMSPRKNLLQSHYYITYLVFVLKNIVPENFSCHFFNVRGLVPGILYLVFVISQQEGKQVWSDLGYTLPKQDKWA